MIATAGVLVRSVSSAVDRPCNRWRRDKSPNWQRRALDILEGGNLNPVHEAWLIEMSHRTKVPERQHFAYLSAVEMAIAGDTPPLAGSEAGGWA